MLVVLHLVIGLTSGQINKRMSNPILTSKCSNCEAEFDLEWSDEEYVVEFCPFCGESLDEPEDVDSFDVDFHGEGEYEDF